MNDDPIAFFITIATYGTRLPGDQRGWVEYRRGWQLADPIRELEARAKMSEDTCVLDLEQRQLVEQQIAETCEHREWLLHASSCRSNHMHFVIGSKDVAPKKIRKDVKAWCTRKLKECSDCHRQEWWAERGSIRWIFDEEELQIVIGYVNEVQDRKLS